MSDFQLWFSTGFGHIVDTRAYDHIAFVVALTVMFSVKDWRQLLIQITAFTVGHSLTLALSVLNIITVKQYYIELLIPFTILLTALNNIFILSKNKTGHKLNYGFAMAFGLIHGMGFSYLLKAMLGKEESVLGPLFAFNIGLEVGQVLIVGILFTLSLILTRILKLKIYYWQFFASITVLVISFYLLFTRF
jgi:hypothetical protein